MKQHKSTFVLNMLDYKGTVLLRKEAVNQQASDTVKVWHCFLNCYDERLIGEGGTAVEGQYVWLSFLPIEDKGSNPELDAFLQYDKKPDGWGMQAWLAGEIFRVCRERHDGRPRGRPECCDAGERAQRDPESPRFRCEREMAATDVGNRVGSVCVVGLQVQNGKFVRVDPPQPGTFDCNGDKPLVPLTIDPAKEYRG